MQQISIIGAGRVGKTLGRLLYSEADCTILDILNSSKESGEVAAQFIGGGTPLSSVEELRTADILLIGTEDSSISDATDLLVAQDLIKDGTVVFHCSGALPSSVLSPVRDKGGAVASIHPIRSFAEPELAVDNFKGTYCGVEGDEEALQILEPLFREIGGECFRINPEKKTLYHTGLVMICNYLYSLVEVSYSTFEEAGIPREVAKSFSEPLVRGTIDNIFQLGTESLTGPISRGDLNIVKNQLETLNTTDRDKAILYTELGKIAVKLAEKQRRDTKNSLEEISKLLSNLN